MLEGTVDVTNVVSRSDRHKRELFARFLYMGQIDKGLELYIADGELSAQVRKKTARGLAAEDIMG